MQTWIPVSKILVNISRKENREMRQTWLCITGESVHGSNVSWKQVGNKYQMPLKLIHDLLALLAIIKGFYQRSL